MCACEPSYVCSLCAGTWLADDYPELPDEGERDEARRYGGGEREASEDDA